MTALTLAILALSTPAPLPQEPDALVLYSAGIDQLMSDPRDAGLVRVLRLIEPRLIDLGRDFGDELNEEAIRLGSELLLGSWCLRVGMEEAGPRAQLTVECEDDATAFRLATRVNRVLTDLGAPLQAGEGTRVWQTHTPFGPLFCDRPGEAEEHLVRFCVGTPVEEPFAFQGSGLEAGVEPLFFARYDGQRFGKLVETFAFGGPEMNMGWNFMELMGFVGEAAPTRTWAMGEQGGRLAFVSRIEGYETWIRQRGATPDAPLTEDDLRRIPADATVVNLFPVHTAGLLSFFDHFEPGAANDAREAVRAFTGVDLQTELLELMGPSGGLYASRSTGGGGLMSLVGIVELSDPEQMALSLSRLTAFAQRAAQGATAARMTFEAWSFGEVPCSTLVFRGLPVPLELSYAVADDALFVALSPGALRAALGQLGRTTSVLDHRRIGSLTAADFEHAVGFGFVDAPYYIERGYGLASLVASALANAVRSPYDSERNAGEVLPTLPNLASGTKAWVSFARIEGGDRVQVCTFDRSWMVDATVLAGTPLAHSYVGIAAMGIVASIALPNLMSARSASNESAAIATLRSLTAAQAQVQASCAIDCDSDGIGEYAFFGELAGARPMRVAGGEGTAWGRTGQDELNPPFLASAFGNLQDDGSGEAVVMRNGYYYKVYLAGANRRNGVRGVAEPMRGWPQQPPRTDTEGCEAFWCCYAWPAEAGSNGTRVFFVNQEGDILQFDNRGGVYQGLFADGGNQPTFEAAFTSARDMASQTAYGTSGQDGNSWVPVQ